MLSATLAQAQETNSAEQFNRKLLELQERFDRQQRELRENFEKQQRERCHRQRMVGPIFAGHEIGKDTDRRHESGAHNRRFETHHEHVQPNSGKG